MTSTCFSANMHILSFVICLALICTVRGCAIIPTPQARTVGFTVSGFTLPAAMAYSTASAVTASVPQISGSQQAAMALVNNLVMQAVIEVLEERGRNAGLPGFVVSAILEQLTVNVTYTPLQCPVAYLNSADPAGQNMGMMGACYIIGGLVTAICVAPACKLSTSTMVSSISPDNTRISGSVTTTNPIMVNWSSQLWQSVLSRALQSLRRGPFASNFASAVVTVM